MFNMPCLHVDADWAAKIPAKQDMEEDMLDFAFEPDAERSRLTCQTPCHR